MVGAVFVTSDGADRVLVNRLLMYLRDWEYGEAGSWDCFHLVTSQELLDADDKATVPPIKNFDNPWAGKDLKDVEPFMIQVKKANNGAARFPNRSQFLVLDDRGIEEGTIILTNRGFDYIEETGLLVYHDTYQKVRVPWDEAYIVWCNLDIANMDFEDFIDAKKGVDEDGWASWRPCGPHSNLEAEVRKKRTAAIREMEDSGQ